MKNNILKFIVASSICCLTGASCTDLLMEEHKNKVTAEFLYSNPEALERAVIALYDIERSKVSTNQDASEPFIYLFDTGSDIDYFRAGSAAKFTRYDTNFTSKAGDIREVWVKQYSIIGKCNEILAAIRDNGMDTEDPKIQRIMGETYLFRAHAYYWLWTKFGRLFITTEPIRYNEVNSFVCTPAPEADVLKRIDDDLRDAITNLPWELPTENSALLYGRFTKAVAKHLKVKMAMWEKDYQVAAAEAEEIFARPEYGLLDEPGDVFNAENLNHKESLMVNQFLDGKGGGGSLSGGKYTGHRLSAFTVSAYGSSSGTGSWAFENGGFGWGRISPNHYLLSLYDREKDKRFKQFFTFYFTYAEGATLPANKLPGDTCFANTETKYYDVLHPQCEKFADRYTMTVPNQTNGYKDAIVYRLAETYILAAEAYMRVGDQTNARRCYNKTWMRAGNDEELRDITEQMIMDEHARELCMEGHRFTFLKRLGVDILVNQVKTYGGDYTTKTGAAGKGLGANIGSPVKGFKATWTAPKTAADRRYYFNADYANWPIPYEERLQMGKENFPQNPGYLE